MAEYYGEWADTVTHDDLQAAGDGVSVFTRNFEVASGTVVHRGDLMAAATPTGVYTLATAADTGKYFVIARENFTADNEHKITQGYYSGRFHKEKVKAANENALTALELELRRQNILLVKLHDMFGHYDKWAQ